MNQLTIDEAKSLISSARHNSQYHISLRPSADDTFHVEIRDTSNGSLCFKKCSGESHFRAALHDALSSLE